MSRYEGIGIGGQSRRPRIRGSLHPEGKFTRPAKELRLEDCQPDDPTYFVPSLSIRHHLHRSEEARWSNHQKNVKRRLGRGYTVTEPQDITFKVLEQKRFIHAMREVEAMPEPDDIRDLAYSIRDGLTELLANARSPLRVPLSGFEIFGMKNNAIAYEIDGWRGDRAHYGPNDEEGYMDTHAVLLASRQLTVGAIALAFEDTELRTQNLTQSPHFTIARYKETIPRHRLRDISGALATIAMDEVYVGDPVISMKLYRDEPSEQLVVKHAWESLAVA